MNDVRIDTVTTETGPLQVLQFGRGPGDLVILPGLSVQSVLGAAQAIAQAYRPLTDAFTVTLLERQRDLPPSYPVVAMARDAAQALEALGLQKACVFGASMGGMMALELAIRRPELVGRLALGSTCAQVTSPTNRCLAHWASLADAGDARGLYLAFGEAVYPPSVFSSLRQQLLEAAATVTPAELIRFSVLVRGVLGFDVLDDLHRVTCPVLLLHNTDDALMDPLAPEKIRSHLPAGADFQLHRYTGYGHAAYDLAPDYKQRLLTFFTAADS